MSDDGSLFLGLKTQQLIRWSIVFLIMVTGFGSLIQGGVLSSEYNKTPMMIIISVVILSYLLLVTLMVVMGLNPNKFELVFIPALFIGVVILAMSFTNLIPDLSEEPAERTGQSSENDVLSPGTGPITNTNPGGDTIQTFGNGQSNAQFQGILQTIGSAFVLILVLVGMIALLYYLVKRQKFDPDIQFTTVNEYTKPNFESNQSIIEYYVEASQLIERLKGRAPDWFSPTYFAEHVEDSPGPPLSSYFDSLTRIYEEARFGEKEMSQVKVEESRDLYNQIAMQINKIIHQLNKQEVNQ